LVQHLVQEGNVIRGLRPVFGFLGSLSAALTAAGIATSTATSGVASTAAWPSSATATASAAGREGRRLLGSHSNIPLSMCGVGIYRDNGVFIGELVEVSEPRHVTGILISTMKKNHDRIVLLLVIRGWQMHSVGPRHIIDIDLFL
jgi:hypothetical protein